MIKKIAFFIFVSFIMVASFGAASKYIVAQDANAPSELAAKDAQTNNRGFKTIDEEDLFARAFPDNKKSCVSKSALFMAVGKSYQDGNGIDSMVPMSFMRPMIEGFYNEIKDNGVENAYLKNILDFQSCIKSAELDEDAEPGQAKKYKTCMRFSDGILFTLDSIKARKSIDTIMKKFENSKLDMSGTAFSAISRPDMYFAAQLYKTSKSKSYKDAVEMGHSLVVACGA
jgi:hypothetical protein